MPQRSHRSLRSCQPVVRSLPDCSTHAALKATRCFLQFDCTVLHEMADSDCRGLCLDFLLESGAIIDDLDAVRLGQCGVSSFLTWPLRLVGSREWCNFQRRRDHDPSWSATQAGDTAVHRALRHSARRGSERSASDKREQFLSLMLRRWPNIQDKVWRLPTLQAPVGFFLCVCLYVGS